MGPNVKQSPQSDWGFLGSIWNTVKIGQFSLRRTFTPLLHGLWSSWGWMSKRVWSPPHGQHCEPGGIQSTPNLLAATPKKNVKNAFKKHGSIFWQTNYLQFWPRLSKSALLYSLSLKLTEVQRLQKWCFFCWYFGIFCLHFQKMALEMSF